LPGRTHEVTQHGHVGAIRSNASGIYGESQAFRHIQVHARVVQFRKAETRGRQNAVKPGRIHGPRRTMALPRAARQLVKLLPIAFMPRIHRTIQSATLKLDAKLGLKVHPHSVWSHPKLAGEHLRKYLLVYPKPPRMKEFLGLLYQTRQPAECFGGRERRKNERRRAETGLR
jgi:hypothetical protein